MLSAGLRYRVKVGSIDCRICSLDVDKCFSLLGSIELRYIHHGANGACSSAVLSCLEFSRLVSIEGQGMLRKCAPKRRFS